MDNNNDNPLKQPAVPHPVMQMKITALSDGTIAVNGIPHNPNTALQLIAGATGAITNFFMNKAKEGKLDDKNNLIESKIISPSDKKIILQ